jgi:serine O-acetyltransferase
MNFNELLLDIKSDAPRYGSRWYLMPGFWVSCSYRIRRARKYVGGIYILLLPIDIAVGLLRRLISDTALPSAAPIGRGLYLPHPSGIFINDMVIIGENVSIFQQVTLGEWHGKAPVVHDNCALFAGAKVFGGVELGDASKVGANAVVNKDIPAGAVVSAGQSLIKLRTV